MTQEDEELYEKVVEESYQKAIEELHQKTLEELYQKAIEADNAWQEELEKLFGK